MRPLSTEALGETLVVVVLGGCDSVRARNEGKSLKHSLKMHTHWNRGKMDGKYINMSVAG